MSETQYITRLVELDVGHRVMHERVKCHSIHGHRIKLELTFQFNALQDIGYCIDFKEIKRIGAQWLDDMMDHGFIANPHDYDLIQACQKTTSKLYCMSLQGEGEYCNPTAENISREIFMAMGILFSAYPQLTMYHLRFYETPNCWVDTYERSICPAEKAHFYRYRFASIKAYAEKKGIMEYDTRKL